MNIIRKEYSQIYLNIQIFAALCCDIVIEEGLACAAAATVLDISVMCEGAE